MGFWGEIKFKMCSQSTPIKNLKCAQMLIKTRALKMRILTRMIPNSQTIVEDTDILISYTFFSSVRRIKIMKLLFH